MTAQETFWSGQFGNQYTKRNRVQWSLRVPFWDDKINWINPDAVLEVGCNAGWNLRAIRSIRPDLELIGCDVNLSALSEAADAGFTVINCPASDIDMHIPQPVDLVFTAGVLIHISPDNIDAAMDAIISASRSYVLAVEYASTREEEIEYRGYSERLWRRPFGEMYQDKGLVLIEEGDAGNGFDRCNYWLLRKP